MSFRADLPRFSSLSLLLLAACSASPIAAPAPAPIASAPAVSAPVPIASASVSSSASPVPEPPPPVAEPVVDLPTVDLGTFVQVLQVPIVSLALGEPRVAALGAEPWMFERGKWNKISFPDRLLPRDGEHDEGRIFFGRDDRPRIMGTRFRKEGPAQLYMRWRNDRWNEERGEIGRLKDAPPAGMWGILGHADPEVVCKSGGDCIIKRRTGWKTLPALPGSPRVELHDGIAWVLLEESVGKLEEDKSWKTFKPTEPLAHPAGVLEVAGELWISEPAAGRLHHKKGTVWSSEKAPIEGPRSFWGSGPKDVWLAGASGLAHYDGTTWSRVRGPSGSLTEVYGRDGEIWAAGDAGVWMRASATSVPR